MMKLCGHVCGVARDLSMEPCGMKFPQKEASNDDRRS